MKCPHCLVVIHAECKYTVLGDDVDGNWLVEKIKCPHCGKLIFYLELEETSASAPEFLKFVKTPNGVTHTISKEMLVYPKATNRPVPPEVHKEFAEDFTEACLVLTDSPKASAALSRRCLQNILRDVAKVKPGNLYDEIEEVIKSQNLPSHIAEALHMVREVGNFAAHPIKSESTGEILPVEPHEADWNLDVLEALFDFYFVQPEILKQKKVKLDEKLKDAGKKGLK